MSEAHAESGGAPVVEPLRPRPLRDTPDAVTVSVSVSDPEVLAELEAHPPGRPRDEYALAALRIGVLALKQARGRLDGDAVRREGDRLLARLARALEEHGQTVRLQLTGSLREYFDPASGRFNERVERLVRKDGELEQVLRRQIGDDDSELRHTLAAHFGEQSPLMKVLSPDTSRGLLATLSRTLDEALRTERERILREFSLDNSEGALARLVGELTERHGKLGQDLTGSIEALGREFSLDREDSALSRLVGRIELAQRRITSEFSLDEESSALARIRRELLEVLDTHRKSSAEFQEEVRAALAAMAARKAESRRSTRHGDDFEREVTRFLQRHGQRSGDVVMPVGTTTGLIKNCKVGDCLIELGPDSAAAGARIVVEAKESGGYTLAQALAELDTARKNRDARVGLFVFSSTAAPEGLEALSRYGNDVIVTWSVEDPMSDVCLTGGLSVARALCTRAAVVRQNRDADFETIDRAIREIEKQAGGLEEITRLTGTIRSNSAKILERARIMQKSLERQIEVLDERIEDLESLLEQGHGD